MIVFPAGMYATASMRIGSAAGVPAIHDPGRVAVWIAVAVWTLTIVDRNTSRRGRSAT
jgi:tellurite resistance protein TehA-like permease